MQTCVGNDFKSFEKEIFNSEAKNKIFRTLKTGKLKLLKENETQMSCKVEEKKEEFINFFK